MSLKNFITHNQFMNYTFVFKIQAMACRKKSEAKLFAKNGTLKHSEFFFNT